MSGFDDLRARIQADIFAGMPAHFSRLAWSESQLHRWQRDRLRALLATATRRSAFHRRRLAGIDPARFELADLPSLPVMTKPELMADFDAVSCDPRLTRDAAEQALAATGSQPRPLPGDYLCMATGGSSGQRGIFAYDQAGVAEFTSLIFRSRLAALGADPARVPEVTFAMVGAPSAVHGTMFVPVMLAGSPVRFSFAPVTWTVAGIVAHLNKVRPDGLFGYPSMLARLAVEQHAGRLAIAPRMVNSTAETLLPEFRAAISEAFGAPITDTFATSEGLFGASAPDDSVVTMATDSCLVELVDDAYRPVPPGTASAKVLITNLYNTLQPLIRYELADSFTRQPDSPVHGHLRVTVVGRSDEILRYPGADVHPVVLRSVLLTHPGVVDYVVTQTPRGVAVLALTERDVDLPRLRADLRTALRRTGLADPEVQVDAVNSLPRHPETGKLRRVIPA
jgi:phenylacetate-CoA ligase